VREDAPQARARLLGEFFQLLVHRPVAFADEAKVQRRHRWPRQAEGIEVGHGGIGQQREACEMQALEQGERHERVFRVGHAFLPVHAGQHPAQRLFAALRHLRHHREGRLGGHRKRPCRIQNSRQKSISRSLPQYTLPR
jgi:hypothetical protein